MVSALPPDRFLTALHKMFERTKARGSVTLTTKRTNMKNRRARKPDASAEFVCLVRATDGKTKISTTVSGKDHGRFAESYGTILRAQMDGLKKKAKKPKKA